MRIKIDENLPVDIAKQLALLGHDVDSSLSEGLKGQDDPVIWRAAQDARRFLITQDLHFSDARSYAPGTHCGVLILRLRKPSSRALTSRVMGLFRTEDVQGWAGCFVVASETKTRIRR